MRTTTEFTIEALRAGLKIARANAEQASDEPFRPWRDDPSEKTNNVEAAKEAVHAIESQIIDLEYSLRDPEQDAEIRAEINAAIALSGNWNDSASDYMHTPMEEELFQQQIQHDITHGYFDSDGFFEEGTYSGPHKGGCAFCGAIVWEDDEVMINGEASCDTCAPDIVALFIILCLFTKGAMYVDTDEWDTEYSVRQSGESGG